MLRQGGQVFVEFLHTFFVGFDSFALETFFELLFLMGFLVSIRETGEERGLEGMKERREGEGEWMRKRERERQRRTRFFLLSSCLLCASVFP